MKSRPSNSCEILTPLRRCTPDASPRIDQLICGRAERGVAILVNDSSGLTHYTPETAISHLLPLRTPSDATPVLSFRRSQGEIFAQAADNRLALFPPSIAAVRAWTRMQQRGGPCARGRQEGEQFRLSVGIEVGRIPGIQNDLHGPSATLASTLDEELAGWAEILVTGGVAQGGKRRARPAHAGSAEMDREPFQHYRLAD